MEHAVIATASKSPGKRRCLERAKGQMDFIPFLYW